MDRYVERMTVEAPAARLLRLPPTAEVLAFEPGCEQYLEREIDQTEWLGHRVYLHLGICRDHPDDHAPGRD
jgi:hypothetical protein